MTIRFKIRFLTKITVLPKNGPKCVKFELKAIIFRSFSAKFELKNFMHIFGNFRKNEIQFRKFEFSKLRIKKSIPNLARDIISRNFR